MASLPDVPAPVPGVERLEARGALLRPSTASALFDKDERGPANPRQEDERATMRVDEYRRLHSICLDMAKQPSGPEVRARWLAMAAHCMKLATQAAERDQTVEACQSRLVA
jgi:hypothetical protein